MARSKWMVVQVVVAAVVCAYGVGAVVGRFRVSHRVDEEVRRLQGIVTTLGREDRAYGDLMAARSTHPAAWVLGAVESKAQLEVVRARVADVFGAAEAARMVGPVRVLGEMTGTTTRGTGK